MNDIESVKVEKKPGRGHFFCEKAPLLVMVFGAIFLVIFYPLVGNIAQALLRQVVPSLNADIMDNLLIAASSVLFLWLFKRWFSPDYQGSFRLHAHAMKVTGKYLTPDQWNW